jgi:hypothetical protein
LARRQLVRAACLWETQGRRPKSFPQNRRA